MVYKINRTHGLHRLRGVWLMPLLGWNDPERPLFQRPQRMKTIMHRPRAFAERREAHRLLRQDLRHVHELPAPANFAIVPHLPHHRLCPILDRRQLRRIWPGGRLIHLARCLPLERFMRARPILFLHKRRQPPLWRREARCRGPNRRFQGPMHPLVPAVLARGARPNPFRPNP